MGPKRSSKKENAAPAVINQGAPFEWQQANEALVLYQRGKRDKAIRELDELLASRPSGAACLARAKIWVSQAVDVGLKAEGAEQREAAMLPLFHKSLAVAARGAAEHRSLACARLVMVLLCSCAGRGGAAGAAARSGASDLLQRLVGSLEAEAKERVQKGGGPAQAQSVAALFSPPAWEDVPKDRWPLEFGLREASQLEEFAAETLLHLREAIDATEVAEVFAENKAGGQVLAAGLMEVEGRNGEKVQRLAPNPDIPADQRLVETHTMRQADMDALRRRYQEEERAAVAAAAIAAAAQTAPQHGGSGPGGSGNSGLGSGSGSGPGSVALLGAPVELQLQSRKVEKAAVQQRLKITGISTDQDAAKLQQRVALERERRNRDYLQKQIRAAKVAQFLEKQLAGLSDKELVQSRVLALAEVTTNEFREAVRELGAAGVLPQAKADELLESIGRLERGIPMYYRWLEVTEDESQQGPSSSPTTRDSQGQPAAEQRSASQSTGAAVALAAAASSGGDMGAGYQAQQAQHDVTAASGSSSGAGKLELRHGEDYLDGPLFEQAALAKLLATAQVEQLEKMLPPCPFAQRWSEGMPPLSQETLDSLVSKDIVIPDKLPVQLLPGDATVLREQDALIQRAIKAHAVRAVTGSSAAGSAGALAAEDDGTGAAVGTEGGSEAEPLDSAHLRALMEAAADGSSAHAAQEKPAPVAWLEVYRSLQDRNRGVVGLLDGAGRSFQQEVDQVVSDSGRQAFFPDPVQITRDNGAFFRCLLGLELLRFGAAAASAPGPESVPLQRLEAVHRLLVRDGTNVIDVIDVLEEGVANRQLVGIMTACVLGVMPQDSSINGGSSSSPDAVLPGAALAPLGQDGAFSSPDTVATDGSGSYSSKGCKAGQDSISLEPVSCAAGFSPVADGALLALAHLPRLLADATKQQVEEQAAEVKQQLTSEALAGLRQLAARGRLPLGALASLAIFIWTSLQGAQQAQQAQQAGNEEEQAQQAQQAGSREEAQRRRADFADLWWRRRPEAISTQLGRVGELALMPLLQLYTFVGLQYGEAFQAVGDICLEFQRRLVLGEVWADVDCQAGVVRLTPTGLEWVEEQKRVAEKLLASKSDGAATPHRTSCPIGASKHGGGKRNLSAAAHRKDSGSRASSGALASPRGMANASLLALAEFGYGALEARINLLPARQQLPASDETEEEHIAKAMDSMATPTAPFEESTGRVRRLLGTLGALCPKLQSVRALLARAEEMGAHQQGLLAQLNQGAAESDKVGKEVLLEQAEALEAVEGEAGQALLQLYALTSALDSAFHTRAIDVCEVYCVPEVKTEHGRCRAEELMQAHYTAAAGARQLLSVCCEQQSTKLPGMAQLSESAGKAVELLRQAAEAAHDGGATMTKSSRLQLGAAVQATLEAQAKAAAALDLGAATLQGLLEVVASEARALTGRMLHGHCCFSCLDDVGNTLLRHILPSRWERQMEEARERELAERASQEAAMAELLALEQSKAAAEAARAEKRREKRKAKKAERRPQQAQQAQQQAAVEGKQTQQQQDPAAQGKEQQEAAVTNTSGKEEEPAAPDQQPSPDSAAAEALAGPPTPPATVVPEVQEQEMLTQGAQAASSAAALVHLDHPAGPASEGHAGDAMASEGAAPAGQVMKEAGAPAAAAAAAAVGVAADGEASGAPAAAAEDSSPGTLPEAEEDGWVVAHVQRRCRQGKPAGEAAAGGQQQQPKQPTQAALPAEAAKPSCTNGSAEVTAAAPKAERAPAAAPAVPKARQEEAPAAAAAQQQQEEVHAAPMAQQQQEEDEWEVAQSHRRRQSKRGGEALSPLSSPGARASPRENGTVGTLSRAAGSSGSGGARGPPAVAQHSAAPQHPTTRSSSSSTLQPAEPMRVCSWRGDWMCVCGRRNFPRSHCKGCGQLCPCRNWVFQGTCHRPNCMFPHPPFSLPAAKPPLGEDGLTKEGHALVVPPPPGARPAVEGIAGRPPPQQRQQEQQPRQPQHSGAVSMAGSVRSPGTSPRAVASSTCSHAKPAAAAVKAAAPGNMQQRNGQLPSPQATATVVSSSSSRAAARPQKGDCAQDAAAAASHPVCGREEGAPAEPSPAMAAPSAAAAAALAPGAAGSPWASVTRPKTAPPRLPPSGSSYRPISPPAPLPSAAAAAATAATAAQPTAAAPAAEVAHPQPTSTISAAATVQPAAGAATPSSPPASPPSKPSPSKKALNPHASAFCPSCPPNQPHLTAATAGPQPPATADLPASGAWSPQAKQHRQQPRPQEEREEEELEVLLEILKGDTGNATEQQQAQQAAPAATPPAQHAPGLAAVALTNEAGEYNCFLNVVLQCLWHCSEFRRLVEGWPAELYRADPIVRALRNLFAAFAERELGGVPQGAARGAVLQACIAAQGVNPAPLREALAALPAQEFKAGEMCDASELLPTIYEHVQAVASRTGHAAGVDSLFGLAIQESVNCGACKRTTRQSSYTQYLHCAQATAIRGLLTVAGSEREARPSLGQLLRMAEEQERKSCDRDAGGCGAWNPVTHVLEHAPSVFTLQLAWERHREVAADIAATLAGVQEQVDLGEVYCGREAGRDLYCLRAMACYYGGHYQAFVLVPSLGRWVMFDDSKVSHVGSWADVRTKCGLGRIQPSVLFYEAAA